MYLLRRYRLPYSFRAFWCRYLPIERSRERNSPRMLSGAAFFRVFASALRQLRLPDVALKLARNGERVTVLRADLKAALHKPARLSHCPLYNRS